MANFESRLTELERLAKISASKADDTYENLFKYIEQTKAINRQVFELVNQLKKNMAELEARADQIEERLDILADAYEANNNDDDDSEDEDRPRSRGRSRERKNPLASKPTRGTSPDVDPMMSPKSRKLRDRLTRYRDLSPVTKRRELGLNE